MTGNRKNLDAIQTFKDDLEILPKNGWALHGLKQAYLNLNEFEKEEEVSKKLTLVWAYADIELSNSRIK